MAEKEVTFKIDLKDSNDAALSGSYNYVISNPAVAETNWRTGTISNGGTIKIKEDETILHLRDSFPEGAESDIDVRVRMININNGHSPDYELALNGSFEDREELYRKYGITPD